MAITMSEQLVCRRCNAIFQIPQYLRKKGQGAFCSRACANADIMSRRAALTKTEAARTARIASATERFFKKFEPDLNSGCWIWSGTVNSNGYGVLWVDGRPRPAHRFAWETVNGEMPAGLLACHRCDTPTCVNPSHIFAGTVMDNHLDCVAKGRDRKARGEMAGASVLTEDQVKAARLQKMTPVDAMRAYGIGQAGASQMLTGARWKHVDVPAVDNRRHNPHGVPGLYYRPRRTKPWRANGYEGSSPKHLGYFATKAEALEAINAHRTSIGKGEVRLEAEARRQGRGLWRDTR